MVRLAEVERHENPHGEIWDPLAGLEREELQVRLHRALSLITERQQEAIHLRLFEERPPEQVAKIMGVERATVRSLIRKGLNRLREISENLQG
jgi:RNA polymerase sigma factor (sigma-70 family)